MFSNSQKVSTAMELLPLACLCLLACSAVTSANENGPVVIKVEEGSDAFLPCYLNTKENIESQLFDWKKNGQKDASNKEVFLYDAGRHYNNGRPGQSDQFKRRVTHFQEELQRGNASILIRNTKVADSGDYTCDFPRLQPRQTFHIKLVVGTAPKPYVTILPSKDGALLQCVARGTPKPKVEWKDSAGNILPAEETQTYRGDSYDITLQTTVTIDGSFRCVATQLEINHTIYSEIYVPLSGAASELSVKRLNETKDWALLQCVVRGNPKPKVEWKDSAGNILPAEEPQVSERGGSFYVTLNITVTKTDHFRCVATQEEINHQIHAETYVYISEFPTGWVILAAVLGGVFVVVVIVVRHCIIRTCKKGSTATSVPNQDPDH